MNVLGSERGVTLLELMISLFLGAIVVVGVLSAWQSSQQAYFEGAEAADAQQNLRVGMDKIARTVRMAGLDPTGAVWGGASPTDPAFVAFREAGTRCLRVYADLDGNGNVGGADENLRFDWSGTNGDPLTVTAGGGPDNAAVTGGGGTTTGEVALGIVANPAAVPMFQYFQGPNGPTPGAAIAAGGSCGMSNANRSLIGLVVVMLTTQEVVGGQTVSKTVTFNVRPRNVP